MNDQISVILVNWNGQRWLKRCLDSLLSQTHKNTEIIFVDNGSTDKSVSFVQENYPSVRIIESEVNLGFAGGNNLGINNANGTYLLLLNTDTWFEADFLEKLLHSYISSGAGIIAPQQTEYEHASFEKEIYSVDVFGHPVTYKESEDGLDNPFFFSTGACLFTTKQFYKETGGLDNDFFMYCEEVDWYWRIHLLNKKTLQLHDVFYYHAQGGSTESASKIKYNIFLWRNQNTPQMFLKNYSAKNLLWVLPPYILENIFEILFFTLLGRPKIAWSYVEGWWFNIIHLNRTLRKRTKVQSMRLVNDREIFKRMYKGSGKLRHLLKFYTKLF